MERKRGRRLAIATLAVLLVGLAVAGGAWSSESEVTGRWLVEKKDAIVLVEGEGASLVGRVVWAKDRDGVKGDERLDTKNPRPGLRSRKVLGLEILTGLPTRHDEGGWYRGGRIYNPKTGKSYPVRVRRESPDRLRLRVGSRVLGQTTYWTRVP